MGDFQRLIAGAFDDLGFNDHNMRRDRPFTGQAHTDTGIRGSTLIEGVTLRDLRDAFIRACCLSTGADTPGDRARYEEAGKGEHAALCSDDVFALDADVDLIAISQNLSCEIERLMGIWPNVPGLRPAESRVDSPSEASAGNIPPDEPDNPTLRERGE